MLVLAAVLALSAGQTTAVTSGTGTEIMDRDAPRLRWGLSAAGAVGVSLGVGAGGAGPGISAEVGSTLNDSLAIVARTTLCTLLVVSVATLGASVEWTPTDHWSLGAGLGVNGIIGIVDQPSALSLAVPLRVMFSPMSRSADQRHRRGLSLWLEVAQGLQLAGASGYRAGGAPVQGPPYVVSGAIGIGYAAW